MKPLCLLLSLTLPALALPDLQGPDFSSPESTVRNFIAAVNNGDSATALKCIAGAEALMARPEVAYMVRRHDDRMKSLSTQGLRQQQLVTAAASKVTAASSLKQGSVSKVSAASAALRPQAIALRLK